MTENFFVTLKVFIKSMRLETAKVGVVDLG